MKRLTVVYGLFILTIRASLSLKTIDGRYTNTITSYKVILPRKIKENGAFHSFEIPHSYSERLLHKRSVDDSNKVHYKLYIDNETYHVELLPNIGLVRPHTIIEKRGPGAVNNISNIQLNKLNKHLCHYHGNIRNIQQSRASLSLCSGITGSIQINNITYFIEPLLGEQPEKNGEHLHVIYKRSLQHHGGHCETRGDWWNAWAEEMYLSRKRSLLLNSKHVNTKRSDVRESIARYIEVMIVADKKFLGYHKNLDVEEYILTIMNMVANYYHDATIGNLIDVSVVRIIYLHREEEEIDLEISPNSTTTLASFCKWQEPLNPADFTHPNHYDLAVLLTRYDICSSGKAACNLLGLAYVGTVCNPKRNCAINEDTGLSLAVTVAHEIGHNMGCSHDTLEDSGCSHVLPDGGNTLMGPVASSQVSGWSNCSREFINTLILNQLGECLIDEPQDHAYPSQNMLVGALYNADQQCRFLFGDDYGVCPLGGDSKCEKLWCKQEGAKTCSSLGNPMADGTDCGPGKWCFEKKCVEIGERPETVNGGWGDWGSWTDCSRTCGGGVQLRERYCNNPSPEHNGKYCIGKRKDIKMCKTESCGENSTRFRQVQCEEHNCIPHRKKLHIWTAIRAPESDPNPCALYCKNEQRMVVKLAQRVKDGTRCYPGRKDTCIQGACVPVGCDWVIDSPAVEDVCGVCDGDGTHCKIVEYTYRLADGSGYVKIVVIPKGAVYVKVKELKASENMIAAGGPSGGQYFNEDFRENLVGEYKIGGVLALYTKPENNREELFIRGPLLEDTHIYYTYFKKENPGIFYTYSMPSDIQEYTPKYQWEFVEWGKCSALCGGGTQISKPSCVEERDGKVKASFCQQDLKPEPHVRDCNKQPCKKHWKVWKWGPCSGCLYQVGTCERRVECVMENPSPDGKEGDEIIVDGSQCCGEPPKKKLLCESSRPCGARLVPTNYAANEIDLTFYEFLHNVDDLVEVIGYSDFQQTKPDKNIKNQSENEMVEDHAEVDNIKVLQVNISECGGKNLMNISELDFLSEGDRLPLVMPEDTTKLFKGTDALKKIKELEGLPTKISGFKRRFPTNKIKTRS